MRGRKRSGGLHWPRERQSRRGRYAGAVGCRVDLPNHRSDYLRWRVETYSGQKAETLTAKKIIDFVWASRWELLSFLAWTGRLDREARKRL
jgi:hypothetical protein